MPIEFFVEWNLFKGMAFFQFWESFILIAKVSICSLVLFHAVVSGITEPQKTWWRNMKDSENGTQQT